MSARLPLFTRRLSGLSQASPLSSDSVTTPAEQRDDAKRNFLKSMRPLPLQHYWDVYFDGGKDKDAASDKEPNSNSNSNEATTTTTTTAEGGEYPAKLDTIGERIESVQDFWRYNNNTPVDQIKMRESIYLFKAGFKPIWEDRRNFLGGSWTFRVPRTVGPDFWTRIQLLAIGEKLQSVIDPGDQICGVGLSVRFNAHLITIWHRDASKQNSIDALLACVLDEIPDEMRPKPENYFYKKHADHAGFKVPPELQAVLDSQKRAAAAAAAPKAVERTEGV